MNTHRTPAPSIEYARLRERMEGYMLAIMFESASEEICSERGLEFVPSGPIKQVLDMEMLDLACDTAEFGEECPAPDVWVPWDRRDS